MKKTPLKRKHPMSRKSGKNPAKLNSTRSRGIQAQTPIKKRKKRTERQILEDKLWEECKRIIRKRYQNEDGTWTCYTSGQHISEPAKCQTGHGKPKGALPVRFQYDLRNLRPQCYNANINLGGMSDIFVAKLEKEEEGLQFLNEACVKTEDGWRVKQNQTMGTMEAFEFLAKLYEEYKKL